MNGQLVIPPINQSQAVAPYDFRDDVGQTPGGGKSHEQLVRAANFWRDNYNPLRGLVIGKVVYLLEAAERGDYAELELTVRKIEKRYPVFKGLKTRRLSALEELDWDIKIKNPLPAGATQEMADAQQAHLRSRYDLVENLTEAFGFLALAEFRGFSILQKHRFEGGENDGAVQELHWLPQWMWSRAGQFGDWFFNADSRFGIGGLGCAPALGEKNRIGSVDLPREEFLLREVEDPLFEIALIAFVNWAMARKDCSAFVEIFGLPNGVVIMPPGIPQGQEAAYQASAEKVADGVSGALPNGSDIKFPTSGFRNNGPFKEFCGEQDADVVMAGTGGRLAMLGNDKGGLGDGPSKQHADAFDQIARADARKINEVFQRDFDKPELADAFANQPICVYFELSASDEEDAKDFCGNVQTLSLAGKKVKTEFIQEKIGYEFDADTAPETLGDEKKTEDKADGIQTAPVIKNRENPATAEQTFLAALANKTDPVLALLNRITDITDDNQMMSALSQFYAHADQITAAVTANATKTQLALEQTTAPALADGLQGKKA